MDKNFLLSKLADAIKQSKGDWGRNQYLLKNIQNNREFTNSDKLYLERILSLEITEITNESTRLKQKIPKKDKSVFLNPNLVKCSTCEKEIQLDEKSLRYNNLWYHQNCIKPQIKTKKPEIIAKEFEEKIRPDAIQIVLTVGIIVFLVTSVSVILGTLSMIAMGIGGAITLYHLVGSTGKLYSKNKPGIRGPSVFLVFLLGSPFIIGGLIAYEGYTLFESPVRNTFGIR